MQKAKKRYNNIEFALSYYAYSDHATQAHFCVIDHSGGNHSYYEIDLNASEKNKVWTIAISQGKEAARAEVKRIFRKRINKYNEFVNYVFMLENSNQYVYCCEIYTATNKTIAERLAIYQRQKAIFAGNEWTYTEPKTTTADIVYTNAGVKAANVTERENTHIIDRNGGQVRRFRYIDFWDNIRTAQAAEEEKQKKQLAHVRQSIKNLLYNLAQIEKGEAIKYYNDIDTWKASNEKRLAEYKAAYPAEYIMVAGGVA